MATNGNFNTYLAYPVRNPRYANSPIFGNAPGAISPAGPQPDYILASTPPTPPPVPLSQIMGYSIPQAMQSLAVPVTALGSSTQTLSGVPTASFTLSSMGMFPLLILALVLYFIFKG